MLAYLVLSLFAGVQSPPPIPIYVGAAVRDGFVDVDKGVLDSIADIKRVLARDTRRFRLTRTADQAQLVLTVTGRGDSGTSGTVAMPLSGIYRSIKAHEVRATLRVGDYEKDFARSDDEWGDAARDLVKDVAVWVDANRAQIGVGR